jgi:hypothetical protein
MRIGRLTPRQVDGGPWWVKWVTSVQFDDRPWWLQTPFPLE